MISVATGIFVFLLSVILTGWFAFLFKKKGIMDLPNERSSHVNPTPRGGGLAVMIAIVAGYSAMLMISGIAGWSFEAPGPMFWVGFILIAATGFIDDRISLPPYVRFGLHFIAANLVYYETGGLSNFPLPEPFAYELGSGLNYVLTVFWLMSALNIYNFLDGIDGYAAAQAIVAGLSMAILDYNGAGFTVGILVVSASSGFLVYNWRPARIFMGDVGSAALGFLLAAAPLYYFHIEKNIGVFSMGIFLWFFLSDGAFTIIRRLMEGERIWEAHRSHLYQRLAMAGVSHDKVALVVMSAAALLNAALLILYFINPDLIIWVLLLAAIEYLIYFYCVKSVVHKRDQLKDGKVLSKEGEAVV